jgi:DNA polymerase III delta prime subunit
MTSNFSNRPLLSEVLRPQSLAELNLPDDMIASLEKCVQTGSIPNMLFYGEPGIGKTSAARILIRELKVDCREFNGSFNDGEKTFVRIIEGFISTYSLVHRSKICFIDEADYMSKEIQNPLRYIIEKFSDNARFLLTANDESKLIPAMKSRCMPICFDVKRKDADAVIERMVDRYSVKLNDAGYEIDEKVIRRIVGTYFPDLRNIANHFQMEIR